MRTIAVIGPTACGKTRKGVALAKAFDGEILSADSRQVYKNMDVGTGKDLCEYPDGLCYHMIDVVPAGYRYNLYEYLRDSRAVVEDIESRGKRVVIVGGTGLYVESLLKGIILPEVPENPELRRQLADKSLDELAGILSGMKILHNVTDLDTAQRAVRAIEIEEYYRRHPEAAVLARIPRPIDALIVGVDISRDDRRRNISERLRRRFEQEGMLDEVRSLLDSGVKPDDLIYYGLEYKYLTLYVIGKIDRPTMERELEIAIHQFAKRQMTWFRGMERRGFAISWLPYDMPEDEFTEAVGKML